MSWLIENNHRLFSDSIRSPRSLYILRGYTLSDYILSPKNRTQAIPFTFSLFCAAIDLINISYSTDVYLRLGISAAFAIGYACSCRTTQYLHRTGRPIPLSHQIDSTLSYFWWSSTPYNVCDVLSFPPTLPDKFSTTIPFSKNDTKGIGGPKAIARCQKIDPTYDCLTLLYLFLQHAPPLPSSPVLSGSLGQINATTHIKPILCQLEFIYGFPPGKLSIHSSIRSGALIALESQSDAVKLRQGCWTTVGGMSSYLRGTLNHASSITDLLHDSSICTISELQNIYTTKSSSI